jgi:putative spermidine/putrescine transport system ATP-binding protein
VHFARVPGRTARIRVRARRQAYRILFFPGNLVPTRGPELLDPDIVVTLQPTLTARSPGRGSTGSSLRLSDLSKHYSGSRAAAVNGISLEVTAGEFVSLLGASGSGKTTTLMMIAGFTAPDRGQVWLGEHPIHHLPPEKRGVGVVFQNYALFPHMTAFRNVAFPLNMRRLAKGEVRQRAEAALDRVGLSGLGHRFPSQLSGGQQQRVALARAIVFEPSLLLMDEPLGALDRGLREQMKGEIRRLHQELGITILYVTHDQEEALTLSDRVALMHAGRIVQIGSSADLYERPADVFVARFIGEGTLVEGTVEENVDGRIILRPPNGPPLQGTGSVAKGTTAVLLLRPEKLTVTSADPAHVGLPAQVEDLVYVGDVTRIVLKLAGTILLTAKLPNRRDLFRPQLGDQVHVSWSPEEAPILAASH